MIITIMILFKIHYFTVDRQCFKSTFGVGNSGIPLIIWYTTIIWYTSTQVYMIQTRCRKTSGFRGTIGFEIFKTTRRPDVGERGTMSVTLIKKQPSVQRGNGKKKNRTIYSPPPSRPSFRAHIDSGGGAAPSGKGRHLGVFIIRFSRRK